MAKFKGSSEDWLDDEKQGTKSGRRPPKAKKPKAIWLDSSEANATVAEVFPNQCLVITDVPMGPKNNRRFACTYRKAHLPQLERRERAPVAVGDRVKMERIADRDGVIDGLTARRNELVRPSPDRAIRHVIVTNIDLLTIVAACHEPDFSPGLVDRFLIAAQNQKIEACICVTKLDLHRVTDTKPWQIYIDLGFPVYEVCSKTGAGLKEFQAAIQGKLTTFCGHSGVGKTSLLNSLLGTEHRTAEISQATGKGQHTTTGAYLIEQSKLIDTPGLREFGLNEIAPERLTEFFPEFVSAPCSAKNCVHREEPDCNVKALARYGNYRRILDSLIAGEN